MAWECVRSLVLDGNTYNLPTITDSDAAWVGNAAISGAVKQINYLADDNGSIYPFKIPDLANHNETLYFNDNVYSLHATQSTAYHGSGNLAFFYNNLNYNSTSLYSGANAYPRYYGIVINDETGEARIFLCDNDGNGRYFLLSSSTGARSNLQAFYTAVMGSQPVLYQWSSVPAISGKNGILLPMSTLNDINDGNEVTTSDTSKFNLNDSSNIKSLVDAVVNDF